MNKKGTIRRVLEEHIAKSGGTLLRVNFSKRTVHLLTPTGRKVVTSMPYQLETPPTWHKGSQGQNRYERRLQKKLDRTLLTRAAKESRVRELKNLAQAKLNGYVTRMARKYGTR